MECHFWRVLVGNGRNIGGFESAPKQAAALFLALYMCFEEKI